MAACGIEGLHNLARDTGAGKVDQHQRGARPFPGQNNRVGCDVTIGDRDLGARERLAVKDRGEVGRVRMARAFAGGIGADHFTGGDLRQDGGFLAVAAGKLHRFGEVVGGGGEGDRGNRAAHLFCQNAHLQHAEAKAAMLFRDRGAKPPHLDDLAPQFLVIGDLVIVEDLADFPRRAGLREEFAGLVGEEFLVFGKIEIHGASGSQSPFGACLVYR